MRTNDSPKFATETSDMCLSTEDRRPPLRACARKKHRSFPASLDEIIDLQSLFLAVQICWVGGTNFINMDFSLATPRRPIRYRFCTLSADSSGLDNPSGRYLQTGFFRKHESRNIVDSHMDVLTQSLSSNPVRKTKKMQVAQQSHRRFWDTLPLLQTKRKIVFCLKHPTAKETFATVLVCCSRCTLVDHTARTTRFGRVFLCWPTAKKQISHCICMSNVHKCHLRIRGNSFPVACDPCMHRIPCCQDDVFAHFHRMTEACRLPASDEFPNNQNSNANETSKK